MIKRFPLLSMTVVRAACPTDGPQFSFPPEPAASPTGSLRYATTQGDTRSRTMSIVLAVAVHGALLFGFVQPATPPRAATVDDPGEVLPPVPAVPARPVDRNDTVAITFEPVVGAMSSVDAQAYVPTQQDRMEIVLGGDMTQTIDTTVALPRPDLPTASVVPAGLRGPAAADGSPAARIFDPGVLDQLPRATFQPPPAFPAELRRDIAQATVVVEFVVTAAGKVTQARAIDSTHRGFEAAAVAGVMRWQFKPGVKGGRPVNTRLRVPLIFAVTDR